ncbi:MAG: hypothetical protein EOO88_18895 [Pedobacter sp.]|nr:MAG: hypothetical protein EOO88_18895 [Pedobacter sp.]
MLHKLMIFVSVFFICLGSGCDSDKDEKKKDDTSSSKGEWLYFDRYLFQPVGISVSADRETGGQIVLDALKELQESTDLGADFFITATEEDSLLQPALSPTSYQGRNWRSFFQIWEDDLFDASVTQGVGITLDQDIIVAQNSLNLQQYYIVARLSCFTGGANCGFATQAQAKALVWRAYGYLIGMRYGQDAKSAVMKTGIHDEQESPDEITKFKAEFNGTLERIRKGIPVVSE